MHRFVMELVLPIIGLLRSPAVLLDRRGESAIMWLWLPTVFFVFFVSMNDEGPVPTGLKYAWMLFFLYLLTWTGLACYRAWMASVGPVSRGLEILLAVVVPLVMPAVALYLYPREGPTLRSAFNWIPIAWFVVVVRIGVAWKWTTFRSSNSARHRRFSGQGSTDSNPARRRWPFWLVGLSLLVPSSLSLAGNLIQGLYPWMDQVLPLTRMIYAGFAVVCLYLYVGLVLWPGREAGIQPDAHDEPA